MYKKFEGSLSPCTHWAPDEGERPHGMYRRGEVAVLRLLQIPLNVLLDLLRLFALLKYCFDSDVMFPLP